MTIDIGYGVDMSRAKFKQRAAEYILENFATQPICDEFANFCADNEDLVDDDTAEQTFADEYTDDCTCNCGIEALLVRCINDNECPGRDEFAFDDHCIYVGARIPANEKAKARMLTIEDIDRILAKYLNPILEDPLEINYLEIYE